MLSEMDKASGMLDQWQQGPHWAITKFRHKKRQSPKTHGQKLLIPLHRQKTGFANSVTPRSVVISTFAATAQPAPGFVRIG
jgi:hypothetical protein